uniref:BTB domain-containing protein n=1 Tax=Ascaris lumbricoides TaxID=6252 RepID=A0A0M3I5M6_ASCLU
MIRCVSSNLNAHLIRVGEYLRKSRASYDKRFVDVEIICDNQKDYVHSLVANIHSSFVRETMNNISPPFRIIMNGYRAQSISRIIDWMYSGEIEFNIKHLVDYLAITAALGVEELHTELQSYLLKLATTHSYLRVPCINIAFQPHYKVSRNVRLQLLLIFAREHYALSKDDLHKLSAASLSALLNSSEISFNEKIDIVNIALLWLKDERHKASIDEVLSSIRIQNLSEAERQAFIDHLKRRFADTDHDSRKTLHVYSDDQRHVIFMPQSHNLGEGRLSTAIYQRTPHESVTPSHCSTAVSAPMSGRSFNQYSSRTDGELLQMGFNQQSSSYPYQLKVGHGGQSLDGINQGGFNRYGSYGSSGQLFAGVPQQQHDQFKGRVGVGPSDSLSHIQRSPIITAREFSPLEGRKGSSTSQSHQQSLRNDENRPTANCSTAYVSHSNIKSV